LNRCKRQNINYPQDRMINNSLCEKIINTVNYMFIKDFIHVYFCQLLQQTDNLHKVKNKLDENRPL
jgi:hypothetical protein